MNRTNEIPKSKLMRGNQLNHITILRILGLFKHHSRDIAGILFCVVLIAGLGIVPGYAVAQIVDRGLIQHDVPALIFFSAMSALSAIIMTVTGVWQTALTNSLNQQIMGNLREQLFTHLQRLSLRYFSTSKIGDLLTRFTNDIGGIQIMMNNTFISFVSGVVTIVITLSFMFTYNWLLSLVSIAILPLLVMPARRVGRQSRQTSYNAQEAWSELTSDLEETLSISGFLFIRYFGQQRAAEARFAAMSRKLGRVARKQGMVGVWFVRAVVLLSTLGPITIYLVGGLALSGKIAANMISPGQIVAFVTLVGRLYLPTSQLTSVWINVQSATALLDRIFAVLDEQPDIVDAPEALSPSHVSGKVTFSQVSFKYTEYAQGLHEVSFEILPGQIVAIVGPSGAGKTTLTYLLTRLYEVQGGAISLDDVDIRDMQQSALAALIGVVPQETHLFHDTIRANIALGYEHTTKDDLIAVAQAVGLHDMIVKLPDQYETIVGERGYTLSGGEKQRVAIARILLKNPPILIFDEATSSLDSRSEKNIQEMLEPLMKQHTTLIISHRLSTVRAANLIIVLDKGHVVEQGRHDDLLKRNGLYARLYQEQWR